MSTFFFAISNTEGVRGFEYISCNNFFQTLLAFGPDEVEASPPLGTKSEVDFAITSIATS